MIDALLWIALVPLVAACAFATDFAVARYLATMRLASDEDEVLAAGAAERGGRWSVLIYLLGLVGALGVLRCSIWLAVPEALGIYYGTCCGARWSRRRK